MRRIFQPALQTKVAGRMATIFFLCAGVPLAVLAALTIWQTRNELDTHAKERLRYESRAVAQDALGRLNELSLGLELAAGSANEAATSAGALDVRLEGFVSRLPSAAVLRNGAGNVVRLTGSLDLPSLSPAEERHLEDWGRLITQDAGRPEQLVLVVGTAKPGSPLAAAVLDVRWLFALDAPEDLPPDSAVCVRPSLLAALCSEGVTPEVVDGALSGAVPAATTLSGSSGPLLGWVSALSFEGEYMAPGWTFVLLRPESVVRAPIQGFIRNLLLVVVLAVLGVGWISLGQVRRQLRPLAALTKATARLARQDFDRPVAVTSGDEFQLLGDAFNAMARQLKQQFVELEAFNIGTLRTLARTIDAKSPWTAGHSERVTAAAVTIAGALGIPASEVDEIRRGGLVHDIGKIATPAEILDKPARLTPEEERIMQLHPEQGVHILEPIPAFRPVLPIVGQHHERWDGTGYPARLAGVAIARTARVLAVADVYDALRSDRPYRAGLAHARVVEIIRQGAGSHFDPAVVEAFLRIATRLEGADTRRSAIEAVRATA